MEKITILLDEHKHFIGFSDGTKGVMDDCSNSLAWLAVAVGLHEDMGPQEILAEILENTENTAYWLIYYSALMVKALCNKGTLGKGMLRAWEHMAIDEQLGKAYVTKPSPRAAKYPFYAIYWNVARAEQLSGKVCKTNYNIAESGALLDKADLTHYVACIPIMMERFAYTYTKIGAADVNKIKVLVEELLEDDIPWEIRNSLEQLLEPLENIKSLSKDIKKQRVILVQLAKTIPVWWII